MRSGFVDGAKDGVLNDAGSIGAGWSGMALPEMDYAYSFAFYGSTTYLSNGANRHAAFRVRKFCLKFFNKALKLKILQRKNTFELVKALQVGATKR